MGSELHEAIMYQAYSFLFFASCLSAQSDYNSSITPTCPGNQPTAGSSCPTAGLKCGYGKSCCCGKCSSRYQAECSNSNEWIVSELPEDCSACAFSTHCTPTEAELGSSSCGWWSWLGCFGAVTLAAASCGVATAGAGIIPCASIAVAAVGCMDCVCSILHC